MSKMLKSRNMSGSLREERGYRVVNAQNIVITMYLSAIQCAMYKGTTSVIRLFCGGLVLLMILQC
jgi:hypothetical protein